MDDAFQTDGSNLNFNFNFDSLRERWNNKLSARNRTHLVYRWTLEASYLLSSDASEESDVVAKGHRGEWKVEHLSVFIFSPSQGDYQSWSKNFSALFKAILRGCCNPRHQLSDLWVVFRSFSHAHDTTEEKEKNWISLNFSWSKFEQHTYIVDNKRVQNIP